MLRRAKLKHVIFGSSAPHAPRPVSEGGGQRLGSAAGGGGGARSASEARALAAEAAIKRSTQVCFSSFFLFPGFNGLTTTSQTL